MSTQKIFIYLDGNLRPPKNLDLENKINAVREILKESFSNNFSFMLNNDEICLSDENSFTLQDLIITETAKNLINFKAKNNPSSVENSAQPLRKGSFVKDIVNKINKVRK